MTWREVLDATGGIAERRLLLSSGLDPAHRQRLVRTGDLVEVTIAQTHLLARPSAVTAPDAPLRLAVVAGGPLAFARRRSAGSTYGFDGCEVPADPEVGIARQRHVRNPSVRRVGSLRSGDIVVRDGLRLTSVARTLVDLAMVLDADQLECAVESALRLGLTSDTALRDPALASGRWRGSGFAEVIARRPVGAPATGSMLETRFAQLCRAAGIETPARQWVQVLGRCYRLDFAWPAFRVAAEIDGASVHGPDALAADLRRQNRIVLGGWILLRFTWEDITSHPETVVGEVREALERGRMGLAHLSPFAP